MKVGEDQKCDDHHDDPVTDLAALSRELHIVSPSNLVGGAVRMDSEDVAMIAKVPGALGAVTFVSLGLGAGVHFLCPSRFLLMPLVYQTRAEIPRDFRRFSRFLLRQLTHAKTRPH